MKTVRVWYRVAERDLHDEFQGPVDVMVGEQGALRVETESGRTVVYAAGAWQKVAADASYLGRGEGHA